MVCSAIPSAAFMGSALSGFRFFRASAAVSFGESRAEYSEFLESLGEEEREDSGKGTGEVIIR